MTASSSQASPASVVYEPRPFDAPLSQGDIVFIAFGQARARGEEGPPDAVPTRTTPGYPGGSWAPVLPHERPSLGDVRFRWWHGPALIITHSCELDRQRNRNEPPDVWDTRVQIAPIVTREQAPWAPWLDVSQYRPLNTYYLPPLSPHALGPGVPPPRTTNPLVAWPESFADLRGITLVSRQLALQNTASFRLAPLAKAGLHQALIRYFTVREPDPVTDILRLKGQTVADVVVGGRVRNYIQVELCPPGADPVSVLVRPPR